MTASGESGTEYLDFVSIRQGRSVTTLTMNHTGAAFPDAVAVQLPLKVVSGTANGR